MMVYIRSTRLRLSSFTHPRGSCQIRIARARGLHSTVGLLFPNSPSGATRLSEENQAFEEYKTTIGFPQATSRKRPAAADVGQIVVLHGYLVARKDMSKNMSFATLETKDLQDKIQVISFAKDQTLDLLKAVKLHSPVAITGLVQGKQRKSDEDTDDVEIVLRNIQQLNSPPNDVIISKESAFGPEQRHLKLRYSNQLRANLQTRSRVAEFCRQKLNDSGFTEVETPILFKSTPEGAREFLVPTRKKGFAYALPQSPQQYKQILMASGIERYYQLARCFRDEDQRADRQPEFTQIDLEMAFADEEAVMGVVETLVADIWQSFFQIENLMPFQRMTYADAISQFGSDKPDLRFGLEIHNITELVNAENSPFAGDSMDSPLAVEAFKVNIPVETKLERTQALDSISNLLKQQGWDLEGNTDRGVYMLDYGQKGSNPAFDEAGLAEKMELTRGDLLVIMARPNRNPAGGFTNIGRVRLALHDILVDKNLHSKPSGWKFLWVTDFPLISLDESITYDARNPSYVSTHHPFTAPKTAHDVDLLASDPTKAIAAHYDLVLNGVELGGGSRRIHSAAMQGYILEHVLKLSEERTRDFKHLLQVLDSGCPPHAGIALGFDRLIAIMTAAKSVRDVIAFPKSGSGEDPLVGSPAPLSESQLGTYNLALK